MPREWITDQDNQVSPHSESGQAEETAWRVCSRQGKTAFSPVSHSMWSSRLPESRPYQNQTFFTLKHSLDPIGRGANISTNSQPWSKHQTRPSYTFYMDTNIHIHTIILAFEHLLPHYKTIEQNRSVCYLDISRSYTPLLTRPVTHQALTLFT